MREIASFFRRLVSRRQACGQLGAVTYHQRTAYEDPKDNIVTIRKTCKQQNDEFWDEQWDEFYKNCL